MPEAQKRPMGETHPSLRDAVRHALRERVLGGELPPGARLVERQLAQELGVSRLPVREALRELAAEGFVEERPRRGMVVRVLSDHDIEDLFEVRGALEVLVVRRVTGALREPGRAELAAVLQAAEQALDRDPRAAVSANSDFHDVLVRLAGSRTLTETMAPMGARLRWLLRQHEDPAAIHAEHVRIADAITSGDAERAAKLTAQHLETSRRAVREVLGRQPGAR